MPSVDTIASLAARLERVVADRLAARSRLGFFAALYLKMTRRVEKRLGTGHFDDDARMERFAAAFGQRYLDAYDGWQKGAAIPKSWRLTFEATTGGHLLIFQDLLLGVNAHVNFDLGIVAAQLFSGARLRAFQRDFERINELLAELMTPVRAAVGEFSPALRALDEIGGANDDAILEFSFVGARHSAWSNAESIMDPLPEWARPTAIVVIDEAATLLGRLVAGAEVSILRERESRDVEAVIRALTHIESRPNR
jgi:hypothetical protein